MNLNVETYRSFTFTLIINTSSYKAYANTFKIYTLIVNGVLSNVSINASATSVIQSFTIVYISSSSTPYQEIKNVGSYFNFCLYSGYIMDLSTITTISSAITLNSKLGWRPVAFTFPTSLSGYTISSNTFTYSDGSGSTSYQNDAYVINANTWYSSYPPYRMFDNNTSTYYMCGVNTGTNYKLDGTTETYNRNAYVINTAPATFQGGNSNNSAYWSTNGYIGKYFQLQFPFNFVLTKIYMAGEVEGTWTRSPKTLFVFGSTDGTT